jgi:hypothetical protein
MLVKDGIIFRAIGMTSDGEREIKTSMAGRQRSLFSPRGTFTGEPRPMM